MRVIVRAHARTRVRARARARVRACVYVRECACYVGNCSISFTKCIPFIH